MTIPQIRYIIGAVVEGFVKQSLLYDFYGSLLTQRQREVYEAYFLENYSLAETAEGFGISRQAVYDLIKRCCRLLEEYEEKLGLVERFINIKEEISKIENCSDLETAKSIALKIKDML